MNFAIGFVIYNSDKTLLERLKFLNDEGYDIFIFDNSSEVSLVRTFTSQYKKNRYFTSGKNVGLGIGLSTICSNAYYENFNFLLFFDQDTVFTNKTIQFAKNLIYKKSDFINNFAILSLNSKSDNNNAHPRIIKKNLIISSGSIFNLQVNHKLNWHNTRFFVDNVDYEYCLRASSSGYYLGEFTSVPEFDHVSGQEDKEYYFFKKKYMLRSYSYSRVIDSIKTYFSLFNQSIYLKNYKYLFLFIRSFLIFVYFQLLVRILNINPLKKQ